MPKSKMHVHSDLKTTQNEENTSSIVSDLGILFTRSATKVLGAAVPAGDAPLALKTASSITSVH